MISFKSYLIEDTTKHTLHVFDIDDTLLHTSAKIHVRNKEGKVVDTLTNQQFNDHKLPAGHSYDFGEFRDAAKFRKESKPIHSMINKVKSVVSKPGHHVIFNTARANFDDKNTFLGAFKDHGIPMHKIHVIRAGNINMEGPPAEKKAVVIHGYIKKHKYNVVHMYDDSKTNLRSFLSLRNKHPNTNFHAHHIVGSDAKRFVNENFADGRNPEDKGDSKRYNVPTKASITTLRRIAKEGGRRGQLAHWMANMKSGKRKN
jgi:hypothetical protein